MGKPSVVGCGVLVINEEGKYFQVGDHRINEGDSISIDGATGEVLLGEIKTRPSEIIQVVRGGIKPEDSQLYQDFTQLLTWADEVRRMNVRANADTPEDAEMAFAFGAEGIGLARTEHMFFERDRLPFIKEMILSETEEDRRRFLDKLLPFQRKDFYELFKAMRGNPVTIRTLDPPLHEFLPKKEDLMVEIAELLEIRPADVLDTTSFYTHFWTHAKGKKVIVVCRSLSCEVLGGSAVLEEIKRQLGIEEHETTPDGQWSFMTEECLAACEHAPCMLINEKLHKCVKVADLDRILDDPNNDKLEMPRSDLFDAP